MWILACMSIKRVTYNVCWWYTLANLVPLRTWFCCCRSVAEKGVHVPAVRQSVVLESLPQATHSRQTCRTSRGVPVCHLRASVLLEEFPDDAYIHVSQIPAGRYRHKVLLARTSATPRPAGSVCDEYYAVPHHRYLHLSVACRSLLCSFELCRFKLPAPPPA